MTMCGFRLRQDVQQAFLTVKLRGRHTALELQAAFVRVTGVSRLTTERQIPLPVVRGVIPLSRSGLTALI